MLSWLSVIALFLPRTHAQTPQAQPLAQPRAQEVRVFRYEIDVRLEPEKSFLHATAKLILMGAKCPGAIELELNPRLKILEVTDARGRKLEFDRGRRVGSPKLALRIAEPCDANPFTTLAFTYEGVFPPGLLDYITKDGILLRDEARWYPAIDFSEFTDNDIKIRLPIGWLAISSGDQPTENSGVSSGIQRWTTARPVSSRSLVALPFSHLCSGYGGGIEDTPMGGVGSSGWACVAPEYESRASKLGLGNLLETYSLLLRGPAVRDLKLVQGFPGQRGVLGYSAPGFLVVSEDVVKHAGEKDYAPEFLPHEIAHQWFPIEVTLKSEADGWLAESLAEYLAWRYLEGTAPEQAHRMVARAMRDALGPKPLRPLSRGLKLFAEENWEVTHATLYDRGMLVWRTLETVIDRERVDRALREYYRRYAGQSASIADFHKICEEISGRNLGWFFDYFINGTELPEIELRRLPSSVPNEMAGEIRLKNVPPDFEARVELRIETTGAPVTHSVATRGEVTPFTVTVPRTVIRVILDPNSRILRRIGAAPKSSPPVGGRIN